MLTMDNGCGVLGDVSYFARIEQATGCRTTGALRIRAREGLIET